MASSPGRSAPLPPSLHDGLARALAEHGVTELYAHQAEAFDLAMSGQHFVVATPTASGKSLCFHLPILQTLARDRDAHALYLYPTKALARDQETSLGELIAASGIGVSRIVYDGDTPGDARRRAREQGAVIMRTAKNSKTARVFLDYVRGPEGRGIFARHGFLIP